MFMCALAYPRSPSVALGCPRLIRCSPPGKTHLINTLRELHGFDQPGFLITDSNHSDTEHPFSIWKPIFRRLVGHVPLNVCRVFAGCLPGVCRVFAGCLLIYGQLVAKHLVKATT